MLALFGVYLQIQSLLGRRLETSLLKINQYIGWIQWRCETTKCIFPNCFSPLLTIYLLCEMDYHSASRFSRKLACCPLGKRMEFLCAQESRMATRRKFTNIIKIKEWRIPLWWLCCYTTPVWLPTICLVPIIPCLEPHLCLLPHPLSGTPPHVWYHTPCLEPHPHVWNPIPMSESPSSWSGTPSLTGTSSPVQNCIPCLISHPQGPNPLTPTPSVPTPLPVPLHPSGHLVLTAPVWSLTAPYVPDLAPDCTLFWTSYPPATLLLPPTLT